MTVLIEEESNRLRSPPEGLEQAFLNINSNWKSELGLKQLPFQIERADNDLLITPQNVCGQIEVGGQVFEIAPKYLTRDDEAIKDWRSKFLSIIAFSGGDKFELDFAERIHGASTDSSLADILARAFLNEVSMALVQGAPADYQQREELRPNAQGRLVTRKLYPQILKDPTQLWYRTSEYSTDTQLSRVLRWACRRFIEIASSQHISNKLAELEMEFSEAEIVQRSEILPKTMFISSQHRRFEEALRIAQWLAENTEAAYSGEDVTLPGILFKSNNIYEEFVDAVFSRIGNELTYEGKTSKILADGSPPARIYPDHVFSAQDGVVLILDSKYKSKNGKPRSKNFYQVLAYGRSYETKTVGLVYPKINHDDCIWRIKPAGEPKKVIALQIDPVDYVQDPDSFFAETEEMIANALS